MGILAGPLARDKRDDQLVLRIEGDVIPVVAPELVSGIPLPPMHLFLVDKGPLLIELGLTYIKVSNTFIVYRMRVQSQPDVSPFTLIEGGVFTLNEGGRGSRELYEMAFV